MDKKLIENLKKQIFLNPKERIIVSMEDYFENNSYEDSFATNVCREDFNIQSFYEIFKKLKGKSEVQDIWIEIYE